MDQVKVNYGARRQQHKTTAKANGKQKGKSTRKRARVVSDDEGDEEREAKRAHFAVFVVHNKLKPKLASLPAEIPCVAFRSACPPSYILELHGCMPVGARGRVLTGHAQVLRRGGD